MRSSSTIRCSEAEVYEGFGFISGVWQAFCNVPLRFGIDLTRMLRRNLPRCAKHGHSHSPVCLILDGCRDATCHAVPNMGTATRQSIIPRCRDASCHAVAKHGTATLSGCAPKSGNIIAHSRDDIISRRFSMDHTWLLRCYLMLCQTRALPLFPSLPALPSQLVFLTVPLPCSPSFAVTRSEKLGGGVLNGPLVGIPSWEDGANWRMVRTQRK